MKRGYYQLTLDVIRVLAILGVVTIHTANTVYERIDFFGGISWWFAIFLNSISRISVPLFILVSGSLILNKDETFKNTLKRTVNRLFIPLIIWAILTAVWNDGHPGLLPLNQALIFRLFSGHFYDLYFLIILIGLYSISPLLRSYIKNTSLKPQINLAYFFIGVGVCQVLLQYILGNCSSENFFTLWVPYTGLFITGYILVSNPHLIPSRLFSFVLYIFGLLLTIVLNFFYYLYHSRGINIMTAPGCLTHYSDYYLSINVLIMSLTIFSLLSKINFEKNTGSFFKKTIYSLARSSFGIYLVHLFLITIWDGWLRWDVDHNTLPLIIYLLVKFFVVFFGSYLLVWFLIKIPVIRRCFGEIH